MKKIHNSLNHDLLFPFSFVYQDTKSPQNELSDHMHDHYEIVYVYNGKGTFLSVMCFMICSKGMYS
ncbi:AraC family ligand binding domain-containing protein [Peribacillus frigoritolerans]|nr:AraC family ligand binding domain-containing protein [Peribacillus frigoritolerans]